MQLAHLPNGPMIVPRALGWLVRLRPLHSWALVLVALNVAALGDRATGLDLWFGPAYLLVVCLAAWAHGWRAGQLVGIAVMAVTFAINGLSLYPYGGAEFAANVIMRFAAISVVIALVAATRRAYLREWHLARTDMLTGALNRQAFFELADSGSSRNWRLLVYADLDGLKRINDRDGHEAGDVCLKAFAAAVGRSIRRHDLFARVGGDEFLLLLPVRDEAAARTVAKRLHGQMNGVAAHDGSLLRCSVGAVAVAPGPVSIDELVRLGDDLMYRAKQAGAALAFSDVRAVGDATRATSRPLSPGPTPPAIMVGRSLQKPASERRGALPAQA